jgi:hypothetical protein
MSDRSRRQFRVNGGIAPTPPPPLPALPPLRFADARMTLTVAVPGLWVGAMPESGQDLSRFGEGLRVYVMRDEVGAPTYEGAEVVHVPLVDNVKDEVTTPPTVQGAALPELFAIAREVGERVFDKKVPTVVCCAWGYNRSVLIAAWALVLRKRNPTAVIAGLNAARGPHPMGYGQVLNNPSFRAIVIGAGPAPVAAATPKPAEPAAAPAAPAAPAQPEAPPAAAQSPDASGA